MAFRMTQLSSVALAWAMSTASAQAHEQDSYDVVLFEENRMVPMRDGVRIATDIYRPAREGAVVEDRRPLLLHRQSAPARPQ